jgi:hypothetical protein
MWLRNQLEQPDGELEIEYLDVPHELLQSVE